MADTNTTTSINDNLMASYFSQKVIARLEPNTPLIEFAVKDDLPLRTGKTATFNGWRSLAAASVALAEGVANSLPALSSRKVVGTIAGYGRGVKLTDVFQMTSFFDAVNGATDVLTDSARKTVELMCQMGIYKASIAKNSVKTSNLSSFMSSTASGFCAVTGDASHTPADIQFQFPAVFGTSCGRLSAVNKSAPSTSAQLSLYSVRKAATVLRGVDANPFADGYFVGYAHPNALHSLRKDPAWANWNAYQNSKETMYKGEVGRVEKVRFIDSTMAFRYAVTAHSVCGVFIFGQGAFGFTSLDGMVKMMIARGPDKADAWDQFTPVTYKVYGVAVALNPSAGRILWVHEKL
jgi:N4-gp56 family major capsid protein